jgi:hypothetical protein
VEHPVLTLQTKTELVTPRGVMKDVVPDSLQERIVPLTGARAATVLSLAVDERHPLIIVPVQALVIGPCPDIM